MPGAGLRRASPCRDHVPRGRRRRSRETKRARSERECPQCMRASTMKRKVHGKSHVPAKPGDRSPERSGENGRSWRAIQGARLRSRVSPHQWNGRLGLRQQEVPGWLGRRWHSRHGRWCRSSPRWFGCRSFLGLPFVLHAACNRTPLRNLGAAPHAHGRGGSARARERRRRPPRRRRGQAPSRLRSAGAAIAVLELRMGPIRNQLPNSEYVRGLCRHQGIPSIAPPRPPSMTVCVMHLRMIMPQLSP